ncbi:hypothetical protein O181_006602 [Austropuccinia psidii MF-1]|uniref:Reverse transcriptase Ty1/copia-type domain-containing protein n=1 Tax=Austropuccinia psidii MF-1 TaxID=1389203 RepID=A0A9Q3GHR2_9BASI|nr:hypothetical protein [Austropuccinia psidii MF-1]
MVEYKAHLCAQGLSQTPGVDFNKIYAPTGRLNSLRCLIAHTASRGLQFHQVDVKSAFLNAPLAEVVYLSIPQGLKLDRQKSCLLLKKAIYGLKQEPLSWYQQLKGQLHFIAQEFDSTDMGCADLMLGIRVTHGVNYISLDQIHFTESLLELYGLDQRNMATRPDLSHALSALSQFLESPGINHWYGFLHVLRYLKGTQELGLEYSRRSQDGVVGYSNADWGHCHSTRRSVTGYLAQFCGNLILWKTRKQPSVSLSTSEAEYKAVHDFVSELLWPQQWCIECHLLTFVSAIPTHEDNQSLGVRGDVENRDQDQADQQSATPSPTDATPPLLEN